MPLKLGAFALVCTLSRELVVARGSTVTATKWSLAGR